MNTYLKVIIWKICLFEWIIIPLFWLYGSPLIYTLSRYNFRSNVIRPIKQMLL